MEGNIVGFVALAAGLIIGLGAAGGSVRAPASSLELPVGG